MGTYGNFLWHLLVQCLILVFIVVSVTGLGVGVGLIVSSQKIVRMFHTVNRWVSTRHALKSVEVPRETDRAAHRYQRWIAGGFVLGGLVAIFGLVAGFDSRALGAMVTETRLAPVAAIAFDSLKWFLVLGSAFGVVVGAMLLFYPNAELTLEKYANRWVSSRQIVRSGDEMHMGLDLLVEAHPTPAGWIVACTSVAAVICGIIMLVRYY